MAQIRFGTDGWRGVIADDFTYQNVAFVAQAIAEYLKERLPKARVCVGYDRRFSSEHFAARIAEVLAGNGIDVLFSQTDVPTQAVSWNIIHRYADGGVVITASHNPWIFSGVKYKEATGSSGRQEVVKEIERMANEIMRSGKIIKGKFEDLKKHGSDKQLSEGSQAEPSAGKYGSIDIVDFASPYLEKVSSLVDLDFIKSAGLNILHDAMHGSGAGYMFRLISGGSTKVHEIRTERNPYFGGVNPEPIEENLKATFDAFNQEHYDLGIATDGDADRLGVIDEKGKFVDQLRTYALLMLYLLDKRGLRGTFVKTITCTSMAEKLAKLYQCSVVEVPVGFKYVAPVMMEKQAIMGGEESGGYGFIGHIPERDGILAGLYIADMIARYQKPLSELIEYLFNLVGPHYYLRKDIRLARESFDDDRQRVYTLLAENPPRSIGGIRVENIRSDDGYKFYMADGSWVLIRSSGTEPLVRVYAEAESERKVETLLDDLIGYVGLDGFLSE